MAEYRLDIVGSAEGLLTGLNNAQEALQEVSAEAVATGKATQAAFAQTGGIEKMQRSLKDQFIFLGKTEVQLNKLRTALKNTFDPKEVAALNVQLKQTGESLIKFDQETDKTVSSQKSLKAQLRENKAILAEMEEQGLETTKSFFDLQVQTGKLQDQINDTNERIKFFGSDTKGLDGLIGVTKAATAGFAVGQGAAALFGAENENVQKALLKVNAAMAILNGLQEIQQALQKSSAARITIETGLIKLKTLFLGQEAIATEAVNAGQARGIALSKAFRIALASIGIGALIAGIGYLIASFEELKASFSGVSTEAKNMASATEAAREASDRALKVFELEERALRAVGVAEKDLAALRLKNLKDNVSARDAEIAAAERILNDLEATRKKNASGKGAIFRSILGPSQEDVDEQRKLLLDLKHQRLEASTQILEVIKSESDRLDSENDKQVDSKTKATKAIIDSDFVLYRHKVEMDKLLLDQAKKANEGFDKLMAKPAGTDPEQEEKEQKEALANKIKFLDDLETIALLQKDIEFEQGTKSIEETRRIAKEKLDIEIDFAQRRLDLLLASGGDEGQVKALQLAIEKGKNALEGMAEDGDNTNFLKAIGLGDISEEDLGKIIEGVKIIANSIKQIFSDLLDGAINSNETLIQNLDDQISKVQANIEKQEALQREGQANNLAAERENLDRLQAERLKAFEKQKQLERQKLTLDAVTQVSSMITASANIFKSLSPLGPVGVALAVVAIATMFAAFANSQVQARKAINQQTLGKGGLVKGKRHDSDGWGGERYVSDSGNETYIEDGEYVVNRKQSQKYYNLIEAINNDNLKQMLNGTGVQLSEDKIEAHKQLKQGYNDAQIVRQMGLSGGDNQTEEFRKDFKKFVEKQESKPNITYAGGYKIEVRGNRTIKTKLNG